MNNTGKYIWDSDSKTFIKISDKASIPTNVYFPAKGNSHSGIFFEHINKRVYSKKEKREFMKEKGYAEAG